MRAVFAPDAPQVVVTLSERNLQTLLHKLTVPTSARTLVSQDVWADRTLQPHGMLVVVAERDETHYAKRPPGRVHPHTELALASSAPPRRRQHEPGLLHGWVFAQHQVWVDRHGVEHEIESMPLDYVENVIKFCERQASRLRFIAESHELTEHDDEILTPYGLDAAAADARWEELLRRLLSRLEADPLDWFHATPLHAALARRIEGQSRGAR